MNPDFPVFVVNKDWPDVVAYGSLEEMESDLEEVDVANDEFFAWDKDGRALKLSVRPTRGLAAEAIVSHQVSLQQSLMQYANSVGVELTLEEAMNFRVALQKIEDRPPATYDFKRLFFIIGMCLVIIVGIFFMPTCSQ